MKKIIIFLILAGLIVGYYYYVTHRTVGDKADQTATDSEVAKLITRDLDGQYYPEFPRNVVDFYAQITKAYYYYDLSDSEIEALGSQAKKLFDAELVEKNPDEEFFDSLKKDIKVFRNSKVKITDYWVQKSSDISIYTLEGRDYARVKVLYVLYENEGASRPYVYQDFVLRKDENGRWKILYWEPAEASED
jgi:hypothetical protein